MAPEAAQVAEHAHPNETSNPKPAAPEVAAQQPALPAKLSCKERKARRGERSSLASFVCMQATHAFVDIHLSITRRHVRTCNCCWCYAGGCMPGISSA